MSDLFLTDSEIAEMCSPLTQPAAQVRYLRGLGLTVTLRPDGRPRVVRSHAEAVLSGQRQQAAPATVDTAAPRPNIDGFAKAIQKGKSHGPKKNLQPA